MKDKISSKLLNGLVILEIISTIFLLIAISLVITVLLKISNRKLLDFNIDRIYLYLCNSISCVFSEAILRFYKMIIFWYNI
ncbi:hypothetical protein SAMN02194393_03061 [Maledivibacter halophilus]|uniref:Uncharacterized protein n=1 Tax=Maledivibacter halophilus TaxID=36842 RepID=A0A1T5LLS6_9FIRM|nr:hypothetical protein SAMN02194393_03061 [Maledivibacter halophilus]